MLSRWIAVVGVVVCAGAAGAKEPPLPVPDEHGGLAAVARTTPARFVVTGVRAVVTVATVPLLPFPSAPEPIGVAREGARFFVTNKIGDYYAVLMSDGGLTWVPARAVDLDPDERLKVVAPGAWVVLESMRYFGMPYKYGGSDVELDCSLLVMLSFKACGASLPRTAAEQGAVGLVVEPKDLRAGDRLYFWDAEGTIGHTGIYLGGGWFIHASATRGRVWADRLTKAPWRERFAHARR